MLREYLERRFPFPSRFERADVLVGAGDPVRTEATA